MTGAVGSLPTLTHPYLGARNAVCTWLDLQVWPCAQEGRPALPPLVTKADMGLCLVRAEVFLGWALGVSSIWC